MEYLYEMHYHTVKTSSCCNTGPELALPYYRDGGYNGVVITDHYYRGWFDGLADMKWSKKMDRWLEGYYSAKAVSEQLGIDVILGMELRFNGSANDYLIYGIDEEMLYDYPQLYDMAPADFRIFADEHGLLFAQAHPFRRGCQALEPELLHGVEVYNGNPRHNNANEKARDFAKANRLIMLSGSDFHEAEDLCRGGLLLTANPKDSRDLASLIFQGGVKGMKTDEGYFFLTG